MKKFRENQDNIFSSTRYNARTVYNLIKGTPEEMIEEVIIEKIINLAFKSIEEHLEDIIENYEHYEDLREEDYMFVDIYVCNDNLDVNIIKELRFRLEDYGYDVNILLEDEAEYKFLNEIVKEAEDNEDEILNQILLEFDDNSRNFRISWYNIKHS